MVGSRHEKTVFPGKQVAAARAAVAQEAEEAVRDLCRARAAVVGDRTRIRHRLSKFLLRHDRVWICRRYEIAEHWRRRHPAIGEKG